MVMYDASTVSGGDVDAASVFFEMANADSVQYRCRNGRVVDVHQDRNIKNCTGGIVWETALLLGTFLEGRVEEQGGVEGLKWCELDADFAATQDTQKASPSSRKRAATNEDDGPHKKKKGAKSQNSNGKEKKDGRKDALTVLEVGAGCGLLGLVVLTEAAEAMENLQRNVAANAPKTPLPKPLRPLALEVDWTKEEEVGAVAGGGWAPFDVLLGTDVVFNTALVEPLLRTLHAGAGEGSTVWLCMQERCAAAHKRLVELAHKYFTLTDCSAQLAAAKGCEAAEELECFLFRLTNKKPLPVAAGEV